MPSADLVTPLSGSVTAISRLNVRSGFPSTQSPIARKVEVGTQLLVRGITRGETVRGNADWYLGESGTYFWAGATGTFQPEGGTVASSIRAPRRDNGTIRALTDSEIRSVFGNISHNEAGGGRVTLDPAWEQTNIVDLTTALLSAVDFPRIRVHAKARDPFARVFDAIQNAGLGAGILTCAGTFVPRHKGWNPSRGLSSHSWGVAIDLNAQWNGYGRAPAPLGTQGSVRELVPYFEAEGFAWGGYFETPYTDGMHFELARMDL